jgi:superfamily II DNA or RNA helicase
MLPRSILYVRAVGFFRSNVFLVNPEAFREFFVKNQGIARLICSPRLAPEDAAALRGFVYNPAGRDQRRTAQLEVRDFQEPNRRPRLLGVLLRQQALRIKIARPALSTGRGMYHEKIALFEDKKSEIAVTSGSANETRAAYEANFERLDVFFGSKNPRAQELRRELDALWDNASPGVEVLSLEEFLRDHEFEVESQLENVASVGDDGQGSRHKVESKPPETLYQAAGKLPRPHQEKAIDCWWQSKGRGILEMATGSGKTITALTATNRVYEKMGRGLAVIIVVPYIHLLDQWIEEAREFGLNPIRCAEGFKNWHSTLRAAIGALNANKRPLLSIGATVHTFRTKIFQDTLSQLRKRSMLIADEVHNYSAEYSLDQFPESIDMRMGLSATPENRNDSEGTDRLNGYFGESVFRYTLRDALHDNVLCPYTYFPHVVFLEEDECDEYIRLSKEISKHVGFSEGNRGDFTPSDGLSRLLFQRARLVGTARRKLSKLKELVPKSPSQSRILVYCGDGRVTDDYSIGGDDQQEKQIESVVKMLGDELELRCRKYVAGTPPADRREILRKFAKGDIQVLVAIRCLDEGVDVPGTETAYLLASSTNPRQFVQRRGRVLRKSPGKKMAYVHDFIVSFPPDRFPHADSDWKYGKRLLQSQLERLDEFSDLAYHTSHERTFLLEIRHHFQALV